MVIKKQNLLWLLKSRPVSIRKGKQQRMNGRMNVPGVYSIDLSALQLNSQLHRPVISQSIMSLIRRGNVGVGLTIFM
jgi:hypothetical protein